LHDGRLFFLAHADDRHIRVDGRRQERFLEGDGAMTATENIFLAWALFCGGVTLLVATMIVLFNATKHRRFQ
jgi:hypothetical protein